VSCNTSDGRETEIGDAGSPAQVDQYIPLRRQGGRKREGFSFAKCPYPLQISMDYVEVVHVLQAIRNVNQLNSTSARLISWVMIAYELNAINLLIPLDETVDISVLHPLGNQSEPVFTDCHSKERQDVGMSEVFPGNALSTKSLWFVRSDRCDTAGRRLTLRMTLRSLVMYMCTTLTATRRPLYVLCDTLAKPPDSTSTEPFEQSGMFMDSGTMRCRLHVLQRSLNSFIRSRSDNM